MLAVVTGTSYVMGYVTPLSGWPDSLNRLSVFWVLGQPYLDRPGAGRLATMLVRAMALPYRVGRSPGRGWRAGAVAREGLHACTSAGISSGSSPCPARREPP